MRRLTLGLALVLLPMAACQSGDEASYADQGMMIEEVQQTMQPEAAGDAPGDADVRPIGQVDAPARAERLLIRTGALRLRALDHADAVARARALTTLLGGFVGDEDSQRYSDRVETTLTIRVPAARFDTLLAVVSALPGEVESRTVSVSDVTRQRADVEARLKARRAAEDQFLAVLQRAGTIPDVLAVQVQLQQVREEIESAEAQLRALSDQVSLSTLRLTVFEASAAGITSGPGFFARVGRAIVSGWDGLLELTLALVTVWPLFLGIAALVAFIVRRRRRGGTAV